MLMFVLVGERTYMNGDTDFRGAIRTDLSGLPNVLRVFSVRSVAADTSRSLASGGLGDLHDVDRFLAVV